jgi:ribonuclease BN (tRNA processing enzyme)
LGAEINYFDCREARFKLQDNLEIQTCRMNHPVATLSYRVNYKGKSFIYGGDHEPFRNLYRGTSGSQDMDEEFLKELDANAEEQNSKVVEFCRNADLVSWDSQYTKEEYQTKIGWGHSYYEANYKLAKTADVKHMVFSHHDPSNSDKTLTEREKQCRSTAEKLGFKLDFSREGKTVEI